MRVSQGDVRGERTASADGFNGLVIEFKFESTVWVSTRVAGASTNVNLYGMLD